MADCECITACPFFHDKMANMPTTAEMYKEKYCKGNNQTCARHLVFRTLGKGTVPADLFPNMWARAEQICKKAS